MEAILSVFNCCFPCFPDLSSPYLIINNERYKIIRLLGEGGFSYVYLVSHKSHNNSLYALKRIRCPYGSNDEAYKNAMKEIRNHHRFTYAKTPYIIQSIDEAVVQEKDGSRTICILLPYFEKSLQDIINYKVLNNETMNEEEILRIFVGICRGLQVMHKYKKVTRAANGDTRSTTQSEDEADLLLPEVSDDEEGLSSSGAGLEMEEMIPFAHRDIKPANVMLSAEGLPVLVDLGSCSRARLTVKNRQQALTLTDFASEHCTLPYRAPELIDVETNAEITEKTDIWSLGCLLYSCCFGFSPFEKMEIEQGANLTVAISNGRYSIPENTHDYSPDLIKMIESCLVLDSKARPSVDELLEMALESQRRS
ncbi:Serine/threonine-protein kinase env7 [Yamadazyma tenuis]|uniref:non-specific serine/threonine protein kinase n=1 Tax=Candida tenuis (strain ATCC 10573 / BCRC 21748 / CBS 615 / JCM 9827 / NBRC 10315 / NRRL Y-1498 / VKM Y-70) TaxID=590646 RepID=G3AY11_CANTC|nr:kinase-like protein [Yamadazyma tenuis ATCC 10573]EGV65745.1 kinase-like protein [Yamadazyma tenuis ATCC 10573]WEJ95937.1 Serine/threonine-protein kinase env7 [Yamadazyma tenuis]